MRFFIKVEGCSQIHSLTSHLFKIHFNIIPTACYFPSDLLTSDFRNNIFYVFISAGPSGRAVYGVGLRLCDELITRPEESYRLWCVVVCDLEKKNLKNEEAMTRVGWQRHKKNS